jgi:hypothetical protein
MALANSRMVNSRWQLATAKILGVDTLSRILLPERVIVLVSGFASFRKHFNARILLEEANYPIPPLKIRIHPVRESQA